MSAEQSGVHFRGGFWIKSPRTGGSVGLLLVPAACSNCSKLQSCVMWCLWCYLAFDLYVWSFTQCLPCLLPTAHFSSALPLQLYHVIWMNLHRDSPIWRRRGFRSAWRWLNNSKQSFPSTGTPLGQTRFECGLVLVSAWWGLTSNPDMTHRFFNN